MLKQQFVGLLQSSLQPAAFRRLCVETRIPILIPATPAQPPLGGCVLKHVFAAGRFATDPAAFRRLCVETSVCVI